jgi:hypothetical protein
MRAYSALVGFSANVRGHRLAGGKPITIVVPLTTSARGVGSPHVACLPARA